MKESILPFQLKASEISKIKISYLHHSQKSGAGFQEIIITGSGTLQLNKTLSIHEKPTIKKVKISTKGVITLLSFMEEENFLGLADEYPTKGWQHGYLKISLTLPNSSKEVVLFQPDCPAFYRIAGSIKAIAGINLPEALNHVFFPNL